MVECTNIKPQLIYTGFQDEWSSYLKDSGNNIVQRVFVSFPK